MLVRVVLWSLADSKTTIAELRRHLGAEAGDASADVPGLRLRVWISHDPSERWGMIDLWESRQAAEREGARALHELIGKAPEVGEEFDVEAIVEGRFEKGLSGRGLAFED